MPVRASLALMSVWAGWAGTGHTQRGAVTQWATWSEKSALKSGVVLCTSNSSTWEAKAELEDSLGYTVRPPTPTPKYPENEALESRARKIVRRKW